MVVWFSVFCVCVRVCADGAVQFCQTAVRICARIWDKTEDTQTYRILRVWRAGWLRNPSLNSAQVVQHTNMKTRRRTTYDVNVVLYWYFRMRSALARERTRTECIASQHITGHLKSPKRIAPHTHAQIRKHKKRLNTRAKKEKRRKKKTAQLKSIKTTTHTSQTNTNALGRA